MHLCLHLTAMERVELGGPCVGADRDVPSVLVLSSSIVVLVTCEKTVRCLGCVASDPATHTGAFSTMLSRSRTSQNIQVGDGSGRHGQNGGSGGTFRQVCLALEINDQIESFSACDALHEVVNQPESLHAVVV